jgi:hypothetical protein
MFAFFANVGRETAIAKIIVIPKAVHFRRGTCFLPPELPKPRNHKILSSPLRALISPNFLIQMEK